MSTMITSDEPFSSHCVSHNELANYSASIMEIHLPFVLKFEEFGLLTYIAVEL